MIVNNIQLAEFLTRLSASPWVAMDTEADSLHWYPERLCLIQISIPHLDKLIDPLAQIELAPLWAALKNRELIFHGGDYDLRLLWRSYRFKPETVFDTMLAARLLGQKEFGLADLVRRYCQRELEKGPQKADWSKRPLTPRMEAYARNDSHYLHHLEQALRKELLEHGRLEWHGEMCARLIADSTHDEEADPDGQWRVKGSFGLHRRGLAVLRAIWHWREQEAIMAHRPPFFILSPQQMVAISNAAEARLDWASLIPHRFSPRRRDGLAKAVHQALTLPLEDCPEPLRPRSPRLTPIQKRAYFELERHRNRQAQKLQIEPSLIASRATLLALAANGEAARAKLMSWQRKLLFGN